MTQNFSVLPMYDFEPLRAAHTNFWAAVASRAGIDAVLRQGEGFEFTDPDLVMAQTCGLPLTTTLVAHGLQVLAVPLYMAPGCNGPNHRSFVVVRAEDAIASLADARGTRCAINGYGSNTGMNLLRAAIAPLAGGKPFFSDVRVTGAHAASMAAVADGEADIAAIDCVTWAHLARLEPALTGRLRILAETPASPALPLVVPASTPAAAIESLRQALHAVADDPTMRPICHALLIAGFAELPLSAYDAVGALVAQATAAGYPRLE